MKILAIRGRNIASLEGNFAIDFTTEPLLSAGIFAIAGPTGAGKSTLLDTLCLALFGRTPRTDVARENNVKLRDVNDDVLLQSDPRFLLRRGTASGYAEVDFLAVNGFRYRARWSVGRARDKENGRLKSVQLTVYNLDKEEEVGGSRSDLQASLVELVGLSFEQFTRSVLLAQNDFSTFLKAEQSEKAALLEKLTGTEHYSAISREIYARCQAAKEAYERVAGVIRGIEVWPEEEEKALKASLAEAEKEYMRLEKMKTEQQALQEAVRTIEQEQVQRAAQLKNAEEKLAEATGLLAKAQEAYVREEEVQRRVEADFSALQPELQAARQLDVRVDGAARVSAEAALAEKQAFDQRQAGEKKWIQLCEIRQKGEAEIARLKAWREKYKEKEVVADRLEALLLHLDAASVARTAMEKAGKELAGVRQQSEQWKQEIGRLQQLRATQEATLREAETTCRQLEQVCRQTDLQALEKEMEMIRTERERLLVEQARGDIRELRRRLKEGMPCPVCGSLHHPVVSVPASAHPEQTPAGGVSAGAVLAGETSVEGISGSGSSAAGTGKETVAVRETSEETSVAEVYKTHIDAMTLRLEQGEARRAALAARQQEWSHWQQQLLALQKKQAATDGQLADWNARLQASDAQCQRAEEARAEQLALFEKSLAAVDRLFGNTIWQEGWLKNPALFRKTLTDFTRQWKESSDQLQLLERRESGWKADCASHETFVATLRKHYDEAKTRADDKRKNLADFQTERRRLLGGRAADEVEQTYRKTVEAGKQRLQQLAAVQTEQAGKAEQFRGSAGQLANDLKVASEALKARRIALENWETAYAGNSAGRSLADALTLAGRQKTEIAFRLRTQLENKQKVAAMQAELASCRQAAERWAKLNDLAGSADGGKFRRIAQGYTLDVLLGYANVQLRELTRRYRLERVPDTLALQVIDRDMCDEIRTVHSLSGGESFLVSLALALGLSSLSSNRMKVESLFIDEGFGSLDGETLRLAMDALENLRTQGRKIGVISHVQEMTERIPVQVRVCRAGNGRSSIEVVSRLFT